VLKAKPKNAARQKRQSRANQGKARQSAKLSEARRGLA